MGRFTFSKAERLSKEKSIKELFEKGSSFYLYPFKVLFLTSQNSESKFNQILISVSSRTFPRAVDRNLIKRRMREAYRLQKEVLESRSERGTFAFVYTAKSILPFAEIKAKLFLVLQKFEKLDLN